MTNQGDQQATVRNLTGTVLDYAGDWHALFDGAGIANGHWNGRLVAWINIQLGTSYSNIQDAMTAFAVSQGYVDWSAMGVFVIGGGNAAMLMENGSYILMENGGKILLEH